jgi:hypothetical protein
MERAPTITETRKIFGMNFLGPEEIEQCAKQLGIRIPAVIPEIPYNLETLKRVGQAGNHLLALSVSYASDNSPINLLHLRTLFGTDPNYSEPCFYNQDWYLHEEFATSILETRWNLISKSVIGESRGENPESLTAKHAFPSAVSCAWIFFLVWFHTGEILWKDDYIWCNDRDHNNDRIYVGRYSDAAGINKNGFEIHRHLSLKSCYGVIDNLS